MIKALGILLLGLNAAVFANQTSEDFAKFKDFAHSLQSQPSTAVNNFDVKENIKDYTETPKEERYHSGVQAQSNDLSEQAAMALKEDKLGETVYENFANRERFSINKNSDVIKNAKKLEEESSNIVNGNSSGSVDCEKKVEQCKETQTQEICYEKKEGAKQYCHFQREVKVENHSNTKNITINASFSNYWGLLKGLSFDLQQGTAKTEYYPIVNVNFSSLLNDIDHCKSINAVVSKVVVNGFDYTPYVNAQSLPTCNSRTLKLNWFWVQGVSYQINMSITLNTIIEATPYVSSDRWQGECELPDGAGCMKQGTSCNILNETRIINGLPVLRDCWDKSETYLCKKSALNGCRAQKEKGCNQIGSSCEVMQDGICLSYKQVYQCPAKSCDMPVICTKNVFCADGSCAKTTPELNENFGKDVSALSAVSEAGEQYKQPGATLFQGRAVSCKIHAVNFLDCCSNKGWGEKLNLARCSDSDKHLGEAKKKYFVHYLGEYCAKKLPWPLKGCKTKKNTYCVFDSKLARIMQESRLQQISSGSLGSAENPQCGGMSTEELSKLNMEIIDFVAPVYPAYPAPGGVPLKQAGIASDMQVSSPSDSSTIDAVSNRIKDKMKDKL